MSETSEAEEETADQDKVIQEATSVPNQTSATLVEENDVVRTAWGLSRTDQFFLITVSSVIVCLLCINTWIITRPGEELIEVQQLSERTHVFQIEINQATWVEWMQLEGIGEAMGRRIVDDRETNGQFTSLDDVSRVSGIGRITLQKMLPNLKCSDCQE